jgi:tyrosine-specific transport protein
VIILSTAISAVFYILFGILVAGVSGRNTSADALSGLIPFLGSKIVFFGVLAGLITIADSFLILALYLRNTLVRDLKFPKIPAFLIACGSPLILFLLGFRNFINTIGFVGTIIGAVEGIIIILIFKNAKKLGDREPEYSLKIPSMLLYFLMAIFILGAVFQFFK